MQAKFLLSKKKWQEGFFFCYLFIAAVCHNGLFFGFLSLNSYFDLEPLTDVKRAM